MATNEISVCAKPVSPDIKARTEQTGNQHGDQVLITAQVVLVINQLITTQVVLVTKQLMINQLMATMVVFVTKQIITWY